MRAARTPEFLEAVEVAMGHIDFQMNMEVIAHVDGQDIERVRWGDVGNPIGKALITLLNADYRIITPEGKDVQ